MTKDASMAASEQNPLEGERLFEKGFEKAHTAVFFMNETAKRIGILQRAANLDFAPNLYTGVGGKLEKETKEGHYTGARRELGEELEEGEKGFGKEKIKEFGRIIINGKAIICYFVLPYEEENLPKTAQNIGELRWSSLEDVMDLDTIPTTRYFMEEWKKRKWDTTSPFTVLINREDANDIHSKVVSVEVQKGLVDQPIR